MSDVDKLRLVFFVLFLICALAASDVILGKE